MQKILLHSIWIAFLVTSCDQKDCCAVASQELNGQFVHEIPDCDNSDTPEINCTEWLRFIDDNEVDILYGGGDVVYRFTYTSNGNIISLEGELTSSFRVSFEIMDSRTLVRTDNNDVWTKVD